MRPIDADALKTKKRYSAEFHENIVAVAEIDWMPTIDAVPVVHSSWSVFAEMDLREGKTGKHILVCRECGHTEKIHHSDKMPNYCQNCGAKMDGKEKQKSDNCYTAR